MKETRQAILERGLVWISNIMIDMLSNEASHFPEVRNSLKESMSHLAKALDAIRKHRL